MSDSTALITILNEAIAAYPTDANRHILEFISRVADNDENDMSRDREVFLEAWNRCVLKSKAFGAKEAKNPTAFCRDVILELTYSSSDASKLSDSLKAFSKEDSATKADSKSLRTMSSIGRGLLAALNESYSCLTSDDNEPCFDEAIMAHRQRIRGAKRSWTSGKKSQSSHPSYCPLSESFLGSPEFIYGHVELKQGKSITPSNAQGNTSSRNALPPQTLSIIGVKIPNKRGAAINQARAWAAYNFLSEVTAVSGSFGLFPSTLGVDKLPGPPLSAVTGTGEVVFVYESHASQPISPLFGMRLAAFLRQYPTVVLAWCRQLSAAVESLLRPDVTVLQPILLNDLFIRSNGLLMLGNVAVIKEERPSAGDVSDGSDIRDNQRARDRILDFAASVLTSSLCLSRRHTVTLCGDSETEGNDRYGVSEGEEDAQVISIVEGCKLELSFTDSNAAPKRVVYKALGGDFSNGELREDAVVIDLFDELGAADVTVSDVTASASIPSTSVLKLRAVRPGHLLIRGTVRSTNNRGNSSSSSSSSGSSGSGDRSGSGGGGGNTGGDVIASSGLSCDLRVVVVRATPVPSVDLIELCALLEASYSTHRHVFRNAKCFQSGGSGGGRSTTDYGGSGGSGGGGIDVRGGKWMSDEEEMSLTDDWREISRMLVQDPSSSSL